MGALLEDGTGMFPVASKTEAQPFPLEENGHIGGKSAISGLDQPASDVN